MSRRKKLTMILMAALLAGPAVGLAQQPQIESRFAQANGVRLHYLAVGQGEPVLLLHGFGQSSHMWRPLMRELAKNHRVIAADLRGAGQSEAEEGYTKSSMARDVQALMKGLGHEKVSIVGHDIGSMVAYAYAAQFPGEVKRVALLDAFLPGVGEWTRVWLARDQWQFVFYGKTPQALVQGRERIYLERFWNDFAADPDKSVPEADRKIYAAEFARPDHVHAGLEYFRAIEQDGREFREYAAKPLTMPMLVITGEKGAGELLINQAHLIATDVQGATVPGAGHWLMEEAPGFVIPKLLEFLAANP